MSKFCEECKYYGVLREPWKAGGQAIVYGFCFKNFNKGNGSSAYPVYLPRNGCCKRWETRDNE